MFAPWYDALQRFFSRLTHAGVNPGVDDPSAVFTSRRPNTIPIVFASPDRAHEELIFIMRKRLEETGRPLSDQELSDRLAHMPYMSLWMRQRPQFNGAWYNPGRVSFDRDIKTGTAKTMPWPRPMKAQVQVDLFAQQDGGEFIAQNVLAQTELMFRSGYLVTLPVNWSSAKWYKPPFNILEHAKVLGQTRIRLYLEHGWEDNTELEFGDASKEVRMTWLGRVEGYIPYPPNEARLTREIRYELIDNSDEDNPVVLEMQVSGSED